MQYYIGGFDHKNYGVKCPEITMKAFIHWMHDVVDGIETTLPASSVTTTLSRFIAICKERIAETVDEQDKLVLGAMFDKLAAATDPMTKSGPALTKLRKAYLGK